MRLGTKITVVGFILFVVGVVWVEMSVQNLSHEPRNLSDVPLWVRLINEMPSYLIFAGIITVIAGFTIRAKQYRGGMRNMKN